MKKSLLAAFCAVLVLLGGATLAVTADATPDRYQVGYAIRDINPWVDPLDHSKGVLPVELSGNGNNYERACTGFMDDNDDGVIGEGDGLFTTVTAVTDPYGKTMMYITIDSLQGYSAVTLDVRNTIVAALGADVISSDQIMVNGNHTHSGPTFSSMKNNKNPGFKAYYEYTIQQITDAAVEAYADRAEAVMTKGSVDAKESTAYLGYNDGEGYHMNAIRHYDVTSQHKAFSSVTKQHVAGSNFGNMSTTMSNYKQKTRVNALESDNTMYVLLFEFPNNTEKEPIVFVNWRAHSTTNSSGANKTFVSGDYATSIRANLKRAGYRAAFFQGASGNVVTKSTQLNDWTAECKKELGNYNANTNIYGRILTNVVLDCIDRKMTQELPAGRIRNLQKTYHGQLQQDSEGMLAAAVAYREACAKLGENKFVTCPYAYTHTDGKTYIINSKFHANSIVTRSTANEAYTNLELNVIVMGDNVAFVTAPNELADRYDLAGSTRNEDNDWLELINEATYGMPFVLGYTNDGRGYIPFSLEYTYNTDEYYEITGKGANGDEFHGAGSYEANTSRFARGTGEDIVQNFKKMLAEVDELCYVAHCEACEKDVEWKPLVGIGANKIGVTAGHYYLFEDLPMSAMGANRISLSNGNRLCLDLKGHKMETPSRSIYLEGTATMNLYDTVGTGQMISYSGGNNVSGGTVHVESAATFNLYGGTLRFISQELPAGKYETGNGGVVACAGVMNIYGGTVIGGELTQSSYYSSTNTNNGCGGAIYVSGKLNVFGGEIQSGKAAAGGRGDCVYLMSTSSKITVSGDAVIDEIYVNDNSGSQLIVEGTYTGKAAIRFNPEKDTFQIGSDIGTNSGAQFTSENLYCTSHPQYAIGAFGKNMVIAQWDETAAAVLSVPSGNQTFPTLSDALAAYTEGTVTLLKDTGESVSVNCDTYMDLNGCDISGNVTVAEGKTLYCMDSQTDDYTVADGNCGKLTSVSGTVMAVPVEADCAIDGYLQVNEADGISFHRVNLRLKSVSLRASEVGIYYKSDFASDEVVAALVDQFGVALSVVEEPNAQNIQTNRCMYSWMSDFNSGKGANASDSNSTLLKGIMKLTNSDSCNEENAQIPVYGRAYILLKNGEYLFGTSACRSLKEQMELVNGMWNDSSFTAAQKKSAMAMYRTYPEIISKWNVPRITAALEADSKIALTDGKTLRVLSIGDGSSMDSTEYLYDIAMAEGCTNVAVGRLYADDATLNNQLRWAQNNTAVYTYSKNIAGNWENTQNVRLKDALRDVQWDVILLQQSSTMAADAESYDDCIMELTKLINLYKANPEARILWLMPWAWQESADESAENLLHMYEAITGIMTQKVQSVNRITKIIPIGTAIQNIRTSSVGDGLTLDGFRLNDMGRIAAGYTLYGALLRDTTTQKKQDATTLTQIKLENPLLTDGYKAILLNTVYAALDNPYAVTQCPEPEPESPEEEIAQKPELVEVLPAVKQ